MTSGDVSFPTRKSKFLHLRPINQLRLKKFTENRRGYWSFWIFLVLFLISLCSEFIANDRPLLVSYKGEWLFPLFVTYREEKFGGFLAKTDYKDPFIQKEIEAHGWIVWPPIRFSYDTINFSAPKGPGTLPSSAPFKPTWLLTDEFCKGGNTNIKSCSEVEWNWLGTDDNARDVLARLLYGFRISVLFGFLLTFISSGIGIAAGALQGYFGGWCDLLFQRIIEIWTSLPRLYLLIIVSSFFTPNFFILLGILLLFSWVALVGVVRAEFLRGRNFEYVRAAQALGLKSSRIMFKHLLPNAMVATLSFLPFILSNSIETLTSLDYLGFGLPPGSASLGELLLQGKNNVNAPWLGLTSFFTIALMLSLLVFIGEAVRDAFDPRSTVAERGKKKGRNSAGIFR